MNPTEVLDLSAASNTIQHIGAYASPLFASTITPAAFMEGIPIGGFLVFALMGAVYAAVSHLFGGNVGVYNGSMGQGMRHSIFAAKPYKGYSSWHGEKWNSEHTS